MARVILKTAKRSTSVSRATVKNVVSGVFQSGRHKEVSTEGLRKSSLKTDKKRA